jgi:hypothetical protein
VRAVFVSIIFTVVSLAILLAVILWLALGRGEPKKLVVVLVLCVVYWVTAYAVAQMLYIQPLTVAYVNTTTVVTRVSTVTTVATVATTIVTDTATVTNTSTTTITTAVASPLTAHVSLPITLYTTNPEARFILDVGLWATVIMLFVVLFYAFTVLARRIRV